MQSTGQTSTHAVSFTPMHGSQMIYAITSLMIAMMSPEPKRPAPPATSCDPALTVLFTPAHPAIGRYEVCTTSESIEALAGTGRQASPDWPPFNGIEALESLDAFGAAGSYHRPALARLFGGIRVQVARGWIDRQDRFESFTLLSPYADATLTHLQAGTMIIHLVIPR